jgi:hypothetical protein
MSGNTEDLVQPRHGVRVLLCAADGPKVSSDRDAVDLIGLAAGQAAELVVLPAERLDPGFFTLSTRIAGEIVQKFVDYRLRIAIVGDISGHLAASSALRAFVHEADRGGHLWFPADLAELDARLERS